MTFKAKLNHLWVVIDQERLFTFQQISLSNSEKT